MAMGRQPHHLPRADREGFTGKVYLRKIRLTVDGYSPGRYGSYFGNCRSAGYVYEYECDGSHDTHYIDSTLRAHDREQAKAIVRETYPNARFYN